MFLWPSIGYSIVFMALSSTLPKHLSTSFPLPLSPYYNQWKTSWLSSTHCILVVENLRTLASINRLHHWLSLFFKTFIYFKHMSGSDPHFPKKGFTSPFSSIFIPCAQIVCFVTILRQCRWFLFQCLEFICKFSILLILNVLFYYLGVAIDCYS